MCIRDRFCCDLLSFVMGRAPADCAWITVMGNVNAIAVAVLADTACIVLAENAALDGEACTRADGQDAVSYTHLIFSRQLRHGDVHTGGVCPH